MIQQEQLSQSELESYLNQGSGKQMGRHLRYYCPIHGSDNQRSLSVDPENGRFKCFSCQSWGYLEEYRKLWLDLNRKNYHLKSEKSNVYHYNHHKPAGRMRTRPRHGSGSNVQLLAKAQEKPLPDLKNLMLPLTQSLENSWGQRYLEWRGLNIDVARQYGVGYAASGKWPHLGKTGRKVRQWKWGRVVFPHTTPEGQIVNLYGRAVGSHERVPKGERHDHLPGQKGIFNAPALHQEMVFVCEGAFDALSLLQLGLPACAVFGLDGLRWEWVKAKRIVFAFDQDSAGSKWKQLARQGLLRGKDVWWLPPDAFGGYKDINEAFIAGVLDIGDYQLPEPLLPETVQISETQKEEIDPFEQLLALQETYGLDHPKVLKYSWELSEALAKNDALWNKAWGTSKQANGEA